MPKTSMKLMVTCLIAVALLGGCSKSEQMLGEVGDPADVSRVIEITTSNELRFTPSDIEVKAGETIEFKITNEANTQHEFVIGPTHTHTSGMHHGEPNATGPIDPGDTASVIWYFPEAGETAFACHIAGHDKSGMTGTITITE